MFRRFLISASSSRLRMWKRPSSEAQQATLILSNVATLLCDYFTKCWLAASVFYFSFWLEMH